MVLHIRTLNIPNMWVFLSLWAKLLESLARWNHLFEKAWQPPKLTSCQSMTQAQFVSMSHSNLERADGNDFTLVTMTSSEKKKKSNSTQRKSNKADLCLSLKLLWHYALARVDPVSVQCQLGQPSGISLYGYEWFTHTHTHKPDMFSLLPVALWFTHHASLALLSSSHQILTEYRISSVSMSEIKNASHLSVCVKLCRVATGHWLAKIKSN